MFEYIRGILQYKGTDYCVIDVNGVGFKIFTSHITASNIGQSGDTVTLYTYMNVKEDLEIIKAKGVKDSMCYLAQGLLDRGAERMAKLVTYLLTNNMEDELQTALSDRSIREEMYEKYGIEVAS